MYRTNPLPLFFLMDIGENPSPTPKSARPSERQVPAIVFAPWLIRPAGSHKDEGERSIHYPWWCCCCSWYCLLPSVAIHGMRPARNPLLKKQTQDEKVAAAENRSISGLTSSGHRLPPSGHLPPEIAPHHPPPTRNVVSSPSFFL